MQILHWLKTKENMQYSPKLKKAMEKIKAILKENDISGFVVLHTPGFSEYVNHLQTSYSCAKVVPHGIEFKLKTAEVGKEKAFQIASHTFNQITHLSTQIAKHAMLYMDAKEVLKEKWNGIELNDDGETSHEQQNN